MIRLLTFCILTLFVKTAYSGIPQVSNVTVVDVTPYSFSVIWTSSEPSTSDLYVYQDAAGTMPVTGIAIQSQPVESGDDTIARAAEDIGIMKVRVIGLAPDTIYYFQTVTISKSDPPYQTLFPVSAPMIEVRTASMIVRTQIYDTVEVVFSNDIIVFDCDEPGALLVADVEGGDHLVSSFAGDGLSTTLAYIDLNNMFSGGMNMPLDGGEPLTLTKYKGNQVVESENFYIPLNQQLVQMKSPLNAPPCDGDFDHDEDVDGRDLSLIAAHYGRTDCLAEGLPPCKGDFDRDGDVDRQNLATFTVDLGRIDCPQE